MRILLTNDDGIYSSGLCALYEALVDEHEVHVVAPDSERSAVGHAITVVDPLRAHVVKRGNETYGWAVSGTPADCVKLAVLELIKQPIDLVISGINPGANVGINVLYSGTVSAATEAAILGIRSLAVSIDRYTEPNFCFGAAIVKELLPWLMKLEFSKRVAVSMNIPALPPQQIRGIRFAHHSLKSLKEEFDKRVDPRGNVYYWRSGEIWQVNELDETSDIALLKAGYITLTPIHFDMTAHDCLTGLEGPCF